MKNLTLVSMKHSGSSLVGRLVFAWQLKYHLLLTLNFLLRDVISQYDNLTNIQ